MLCFVKRFDKLSMFFFVNFPSKGNSWKPGILKDFDGLEATMAMS